MLPSLIASPNYYDSSVACVLSNNVIAFAAKQNIVYLARRPDVTGNAGSETPLAYAGYLSAHQVKCSGITAIDDLALEEGELPASHEDTEVDEELALFFGGAASLESATFATCGHDGFVRVWDFAGRRCLREFGPAALAIKEPRPACIAASNGGGAGPCRPLAIGCESGHVVVLHWLPSSPGTAAGSGGSSATAGLLTRPFGKEQGINQVQWKPNSSSEFACAGRNGQVCVLVLNTSGGIGVAHRLTAHTGEVLNLAWNPLGGTAAGAPADLATVGRDYQLKLWRLGAEDSVCVASTKVPLNINKKRWTPSEDRRFWCSLAWTEATGLLFTSPFGDILQWTRTLGGQSDGAGNGYVVLNAGKPLLGRMVFALLCRNNRLYTFGIDWWVCEYQLQQPPQQQQQPPPTLSLLSAVPTASGFALCAQPSPTNPTTVAIGFGDGCVRVWRQGMGAPAYELSLHWHGVNGRVTALAWHPHLEGLLAFGTDAGQVGCLDTLAAQGPGQAARLSPSQHKGCVYIVRWGPPIGADGRREPQRWAVYSVGNFRILCHDQAMSQPAIDISRQLPAGYQQQHADLKHRNRTDAQFRPDWTQLAVGNESGLVEIFDWPTPVLRARAQLCRSIVNALAWHPGYAEECRNWLAIGTNGPVIYVLDAGAVSGEARNAADNCVTITEPMISLKGHRNRITSLCWSPHTPHHLLSGSFDGTAQIWDVRTGDHLGNFTGHAGRIYTVLWSAGDPDVCMSGSEDHCLLRWRISALRRLAPPASGKQYRPPLPHGVLARAGDTPGDSGAPSTAAAPAYAAQPNSASSALNNSVEDLELDDLLRLVEQKRREITAKGGQPEVLQQQRMRRPSTAEKEPASAPAIATDSAADIDASLSGPATLADVSLRRGGGGSGTESRKRPALFPLSGRAENSRGSGAEGDRLVDFTLLLAHLSAATNNNNSSNAEQPETLAQPRQPELPPLPDNLLALLPRPHSARLADRELRQLLRAGHLDNYLMLLVWSGRTQRAVQEAVSSGFLPDWLVAVSCLAAASAPDVDASVATAKADGLRRCGDPQLAATYLLSARRTCEAVNCLLGAGKAREALLLCNLRLLPSDPIRQRVLTAYAQACRDVGRLELCAQLLLLLGQPGAAVDVLLQRRSSLGCLAAMQVWLSHGDLSAALRIGLDWLCRGLLDTNETGTWRRELRRLSDRRPLCLEALLDAFDRLQARVHVNWRQFAEDLASAYSSELRSALAGQIETAKSGRQPAISASQKLLHLSLDACNQLLRRCEDPDAAAASLAPLLANHERQVRLAEPDPAEGGGGTSMRRKAGGGGVGRVGDDLVAALSHAAASSSATPASNGAAVIKDEEAEDDDTNVDDDLDTSVEIATAAAAAAAAADTGVGCYIAGPGVCAPAAPTATSDATVVAAASIGVAENKENVFPA